MKRFGLFVFILLAIGVSEARAAKPEVQMYGASWCGPCRTVRATLDHNRVPYRYIDIDAPRGAAAYAKARGNKRGIPLLVIGNTKIVGANFEAIAAALVKNRIVEGKARAPASKGEYGGESAEWWQQQFRGMRQRLSRLKEAADALEAVAADNTDKERVTKLREAHEVVKASLRQLDNDASRAAVPRKYRR